MSTNRADIIQRKTCYSIPYKKKERHHEKMYPLIHNLYWQLFTKDKLAQQDRELDQEAHKDQDLSFCKFLSIFHSLLFLAVVCTVDSCDPAFADYSLIVYRKEFQAMVLHTRLTKEAELYGRYQAHSRNEVMLDAYCCFIHQHYPTVGEKNVLVKLPHSSFFRRKPISSINIHYQIFVLYIDALSPYCSPRIEAHFLFMARRFILCIPRVHKFYTRLTGMSMRRVSVIVRDSTLNYNCKRIDSFIKRTIVPQSSR
ncbi:unnamed protein product [Xylocopa violacea]|uniref:Uncharacterized protein n=1 Tax=Xylocopa violacea TaxID=135666 RepID=A0ABP1NZ10_XYLVO